MPEAPVINNAPVASSDLGDEGSTSEGSSIEPGDQPGDIRSTRQLHGAGHGAVLLSQLRRR
ncbi:hypothetical protein [Rhodococcus sovatensis]|uniref:Uncharacterized protein n=1 Tax=Rhodococcus sovatensis TaxID=1805840 RepID=A0ABZ2PN68_9NOCA